MEGSTKRFNQKSGACVMRLHMANRVHLQTIVHFVITYKKTTGCIMVNHRKYVFNNPEGICQRVNNKNQQKSLKIIRLIMTIHKS